MPQLADGASFLERIVVHPGFARDGLLFGTERGRLHWTVVDPERYVLSVWRKTCESYVEAARALDAAVYSNGPFANYADGSLRRTSFYLLRDVMAEAARAPLDLTSAWRRQKLRHLAATAPLGHVIGEDAGVHETGVDRPRLHYFGRRSGTSFADYVIGRGDPAGLSEAVGGLMRPVADFRPYSVSRWIRSGFWGLAPLHGLVVVVAGFSNTRRLAERLASIGVKDAVQIDGSNSLLFGGGGRLRIGARMPERKRLLQTWGIQFRAAGA